jgi:hypothetical protein
MLQLPDSRVGACVAEVVSWLMLEKSKSYAIFVVWF